MFYHLSCHHGVDVIPFDICAHCAPLTWISMLTQPQKSGHRKSSKENPASASGFKNPSIRLVSWPRESGYKQQAAVAWAAERAALGLVQTPTVQKNDLLGGQGRTRKRWTVCILNSELMYVHSTLISFTSFDCLSLVATSRACQVCNRLQQRAQNCLTLWTTHYPHQTGKFQRLNSHPQVALPFPWVPDVFFFSEIG